MNKHQFTTGRQLHSKWIAIGLALAALLSACGNASPTPSAESILLEAQTAALATLSLQAVVPNTPTATAAPIATPTWLPTASPTTFFTPNQAATSPASQGSAWSASTTYSKENAEFVRNMTIPDGTVLVPGDIFIKTWKFENTGDHAWTSDYSIVFVSGDLMDGANTEIGEKVYVNKKIEVSVALAAPEDEGTYTGYWQMADEYGNAFGPIVHVEIYVSESE